MSETKIEGRLHGPRFHRVPDGIVMRRLAAHLNEHMGSAWWGMVMFEDGRWVSRGASPSMEPPSAETMALLGRVAAVLNVQASEDGHWVVALLPADKEVWALWRDADGDPHVVLEFDDKAHRLHSWIDDQLAAQAQAALNAYRLQMAKVDVAQTQMIRRTLGEKPTRH